MRCSIKQTNTVGRVGGWVGGWVTIGLCSGKLVIGAQCTFFLMKGFSKGLFRKNMKRREFRRDCSGKIDNDGIF